MEELLIQWEELIIKQIAKDLLAINAKGIMSLHDKIKFIIGRYKEALAGQAGLGTARPGWAMQARIKNAMNLFQ